jgi:hypothetical protein
MPLKRGTSHAAMSYNYRLERKHGKSQAQARAIMLHKAYKRRKKPRAKKKRV